MKVLIATPVFQLYSQTVEAALMQDLAADEAGRPIERDYLMLQGDDMSLSHFARITAKFNRIRQAALAGNYDALLVVEADMLPPPHALRALLNTGADVAYGVYSLRHTTQDGMWNAATFLGDGGLGAWLSHDSERAAALWGEVVEVAGVGMGTTLIRRRVLEKLPFRDDGRLHCDWFFAQDAQRWGLSQVAHLGVVCGHIQRPGQALIPDPTAPDMHRVIAV